jgi:hypothetical protein
MYLSSRISLRASIKTDMRCVRSRMSCYPAMRLSATGTRLTYVMDCEKWADRFHTLELETDRITLTTNSVSSPTYFLKETVLRLVSVSMALSEDYEIDLHGLMPYLIHVLSSSDALTHETEPANFNRDADIILSERVIELLGQKNKLESAANGYRSKLVSAVSALILCKYGNGADRIGMPKDLGVDREIMSEAINELGSRGYRAISSKDGNLEMVRL